MVYTVEGKNLISPWMVKQCQKMRVLLAFGCWDVSKNRATHDNIGRSCQGFGWFFGVTTCNHGNGTFEVPPPPSPEARIAHLKSEKRVIVT